MGYELSGVLFTAAVSAVVAWCVGRWYARPSRIADVVNTRRIRVWSGDNKVCADVGAHGLWLYEKSGTPGLQLVPQGIYLNGTGEHVGYFGPGGDPIGGELGYHSPANHVLRGEFGIDEQEGAAVFRLWDQYEPTDWPGVHHPRVEIQAGRFGNTLLRFAHGPENKISRGGEVVMSGWPATGGAQGRNEPPSAVG